ncbi:MAG: hypothetical protein ABS76_31430 [Pelagibacterium sp. SCN 64-44]|nr:MAG: hypothetical protein ABS76_31430 [Pelagibacterium sp. SCN 64-44]
MSTALIDHGQLTDIAEIFRLLGDPGRLRIMLCCLEEAKPVGRIAEELSLPQPSVSRHLRLLRGSRLMARERKGKQVFYRVAEDNVRSILLNAVAHLADGPRP